MILTQNTESLQYLLEIQSMAHSLNGHSVIQNREVHYKLWRHYRQYEIKSQNWRDTPLSSP